MKPKFYLLMGASGCRKTKGGKALAEKSGWDFYDADDFHPIENIAKMRSGTPLDDDDRAPWLVSLHSLISNCLKENRPGVLACSAPKESYRHMLLSGNRGVRIVYLKGDFDLIWGRMISRSDHYMKPEMLISQFDVLEEPMDALIVDISHSVDELVVEILK